MVHVFPALKKAPAHPNRLNDQYNELSELSNVQRQSDDMFLSLIFPLYSFIDKFFTLIQANLELHGLFFT